MSLQTGNPYLVAVRFDTARINWYRITSVMPTNHMSREKERSFKKKRVWLLSLVSYMGGGLRPGKVVAECGREF